MTVPSTARRAGPFLGNGVTTTFSFSFKTFAAGDLQVTRTSATGIETTLVLNSDYSVSLNGDQDASPGGTITYPISGSALATGQKLTIVGNLAYEQTTDLLGGGAFNAKVIEDTFDRTVIQIQQLEERADRALALPVSAASVSTTLPAPEGSALLGWNGGGTALQNVPLSSLATAVAYGSMRYQTFVGNGTTTTFALTHDPATVANLDVSVAGVVQVPGTDYTLVGQNVVFTSAPPNGVTILVRYGQALGSVPSDSNDISFQAAGTGAVTRTAQSKLRDVVSVKDFGAVGDGVTDDWQAIENAILAVSAAGGGTVLFPRGTYIVSKALSLKSNVRYLGEERDAVSLKASNDSQDNILGWGYPLYQAAVLARAAGGSIDRLKKPDFLTNYTEQEALINGGMAGYAVTNVTIENITFDGNKNNRVEGTMFLQGAPSGTFLVGETVTASGGKSAVVSSTFGIYGISVEPRTIVGNFSVSDVLTGATSGATMTLAAKGADDAYQLNVRFDGVSHSVIRNCVFKNSIFTALSIYNFSNHNIIEGNLFYDNNKSGTAYTFGWLNIYVEFDANHNIIRDNIIIGGLAYSVLVSCPGGTNRDTWIVNNTIYNPASDGIRISIDSATDTIFAPKVIGNTVVGANAVGAVGIRLNHGGASGAITDAVVAGNTVRDSTYGILTQGRVQYTTVSGNTCRNNSIIDISVGGTGVVAVGNTADSQIEETLANKLVLSAGRIDPFKLYSNGGQSVGHQMEISGIGTWYDSINYPNGSRHFEFGGSRKASISVNGDFDAINSIKGGRSKVSGIGTISVGTSATTLWTVSNFINPTLFVVSGDNGSNGFSDLVLMSYGTIIVVSSNTAYGSPPARTYSRSGAAFQLALASGSLGVLIQAMEFQY